MRFVVEILIGLCILGVFVSILAFNGMGMVLSVICLLVLLAVYHGLLNVNKIDDEDFR